MLLAFCEPGLPGDGAAERAVGLLLDRALRAALDAHTPPMSRPPPTTAVGSKKHSDNPQACDNAHIWYLGSIMHDLIALGYCKSSARALLLITQCKLIAPFSRWTGTCRLYSVSSSLCEGEQLRTSCLVSRGKAG